jgi:NAD(P)-dependent dehydrogenase (short-subunit alcohol dehydrogenase family)
MVAPVVADISTVEGSSAIAGTAQGAFGRLDFCINNAAVAPHAALLDERVEVWDTVYAVNCRGTFLMTQAAARVLIAQGDGGRIVDFSSGISQRGSAGAAAYASSRAATEAFSRVAAIETVHDILVTCVSPGLIDTQPKPLPPSMAAALGSRIPALPLARPGEPSEVADVVLWLCSPGSSYVTGSIVHVDGGTGVGSRAGKEIIDEDVRFRPLGTMPADLTLYVGALLIFAGYRWKVTAVDHAHKIIEAVPAPGGRQGACKVGDCLSA